MLENTFQLTPADMIQIAGESETYVYLVRKVWQKPIIRPDYQNYLDFQTTGFTLFDVKTLTEKEVDVIEMQEKISRGIVSWYTPMTSRKVPGLAPKHYHEQLF